MARFENGFIKLHRQAYFGDIGTNIHCFGLWCALLCMATWKESKVIWKGKQRVLPPGSVVFGFRELSEKLHCSKNTIRRWLSYLSDSERLVTEHSPRGTLVTILNWERYQGFEQSEEQERDTDGAMEGHDAVMTEGRQVTLIEEVKKVRKKNIYSSDFDLEKAYQNYPGRDGTKSKGLRKLAREIKTEADYQTLLSSVAHYAQSKKVRDGFVKNFLTFAGEWRDWAHIKPMLLSQGGRVNPEIEKHEEEEREIRERLARDREATA
jgi:CTP-dependent riboflavin kinase